MLEKLLNDGSVVPNKYYLVDPEYQTTIKGKTIIMLRHTSHKITSLVVERLTMIQQITELGEITAEMVRTLSMTCWLPHFLTTFTYPDDAFRIDYVDGALKYIQKTSECFSEVRRTIPYDPAFEYSVDELREFFTNIRLRIPVVEPSEDVSSETGTIGLPESENVPQDDTGAPSGTSDSDVDEGPGLEVLADFVRWFDDDTWVITDTQILMRIECPYGTVVELALLSWSPDDIVALMEYDVAELGHILQWMLFRNDKRWDSLLVKLDDVFRVKTPIPELIGHLRNAVDEMHEFFGSM